MVFFLAEQQGVIQFLKKDYVTDARCLPLTWCSTLSGSIVGFALGKKKKRAKFCFQILLQELVVVSSITGQDTVS